MSTKRIRVGDEVSIQFSKFGGKPLFGKVVEERGPLGVGGELIYGIKFDAGADELFDIELPAREFEVIRPAKRKA